MKHKLTISTYWGSKLTVGCIDCNKLLSVMYQPENKEKLLNITHKQTDIYIWASCEINNSAICWSGCTTTVLGSISSMFKFEGSCNEFLVPERVYDSFHLRKSDVSG